VCRGELEEFPLSGVCFVCLYCLPWTMISAIFGIAYYDYEMRNDDRTIWLLQAEKRETWLMLEYLFHPSPCSLLVVS
jgi:hypothetical protein